MAMALSQCSTRISSPKRWLGQRATSPAATMPGAARVVASHTSPSSSASPEPSSQPVFGETPMPTTTRSASTSVSSASRTWVTRSPPSNPATPTPRRRSTPWSRWSSPITAPISSPSARPSGTGSASRIVTSQPAVRQVAATSAPMKPAPTTTTRRTPPSRAARTASASSIVRSVWTPASDSVPGSSRGVAPVATTRPSNATSSSPSTTRRLAEVEAGGTDAEPPVEVEPGQAVGVGDRAARCARAATRRRAPAWTAAAGRTARGSRRRRR